MLGFAAQCLRKLFVQTLADWKCDTRNKAYRYIYSKTSVSKSFAEMWRKFEDSKLGEIRRVVRTPRPPLMTTPGCSRAPIIIRSFWFSLEGCWHNAGALPQPYSCLRPSNINNDREKECRKERERASRAESTILGHIILRMFLRDATIVTRSKETFCPNDHPVHCAYP